jgi:hypothetical protein
MISPNLDVMRSPPRRISAPFMTLENLTPRLIYCQSTLQKGAWHGGDISNTSPLVAAAITTPRKPDRHRHSP